ncbi:MAG: hypothetical protein KBT88_14640 [Gammaproteobacteria bacterium]|nr:hypothetical protein [Gammaproteobacteria bacterium]MBQ0841015.1 hypothetical protein [Gammaproteobacteria bacterium]
MAGLIKNHLENGTVLRWLAFEDYARQVFANNHPAWHSEPMRYAAGLADANKILGSQVVTFDFGAVFAAHASLAADCEGVERISALLADTALKAFCADAIAAMAHQLSAKVDVVLQLPSPSALLVMLGEDAGNIDFDMLDDSATALADLLRSFAELPIAGLVLAFADSNGESGVDLGDEGEACEVLQGVAGHYDWVFALRLESAELAAGLEDLEADIRLRPTLDAADLDEQDGPTGGGLNSDFWGGAALPSLTSACLYGDVPADLDPKIIVERVAGLA